MSLIPINTHTPMSVDTTSSTQPTTQKYAYITSILQERLTMLQTDLEKLKNSRPSDGSFQALENRVKQIDSSIVEQQALLSAENHHKKQLAEQIQTMIKDSKFSELNATSDRLTKTAEKIEEISKKIESFRTEVQQVQMKLQQESEAIKAFESAKADLELKIQYISIGISSISDFSNNSNMLSPSNNNSTSINNNNTATTPNNTSNKIVVKLKSPVNSSAQPNKKVKTHS